MSVTLLEKLSPARSNAKESPGQEAATRVTRRDVIAALLTAVVALGVYVYTLAPSVTLEDSGELIVAAAQFGVPHPPGYPLWTMSGWLLTQLLPLGSYAWRINLLSALYGAAACGLLALLAGGSARWLLASVFPQLPKDWRVRLPFFAAMAAGLALAFSESMWSQSVIAEVYTLNAFFLVSVLYALFRWVVAPESITWLLVAVLVYCLGMTNHHTLMLMLPAFLLLVAVIRPALLPSFLIGFAGLLLTVLAVFAWLSHNPSLEVIAQRSAWLVLWGTALLAWWFMSTWDGRRFLVGAASVGVVFAFFSLWFGEWFAVESFAGVWLFLLVSLCGGLVGTSILSSRLIIGMLALGWIGLLPYGYLPLASDTNPPMNWGNAQDEKGFYQLMGREQYSNSLSRMIIKMADLGGLYETPPELGDTPGAKVGIPLAIADAVKHYGLSLDENFTTPLCLLALAVIFYVRSFARPMLGWLVFLVVSFLFLAFAMSVLEPPKSLDVQFMWVTRVFKLQSHVLFVLMIAYGMVLLGALLSQRIKELPSLAASAFLLLVMLPLEQNAVANSMRGQWFGFLYGYEALARLPQNAVVFGGSDAGRFIPTYMIFGESTQPETYKTVPDFDRRDLFIITQSQLAHTMYLDTLREQYGTPAEERPWTAFERWLGRPDEYPPTWLQLPDDEDELDATRQYAIRTLQMNTGRAVQFTGGQRLFELHGILAQMIFEKNKDQHEFFIEMHVPLEWTWPHLEPAGLLMRISPEPLEGLSPEVVAQDMAYWENLSRRLLSDPFYGTDLPAQRAFSDARAFIALLYEHRNMWAEAKRAYQQAFALSQKNVPNVITNYVRMLTDRGDYDQAEHILSQAQAVNPKSKAIANYQDLVARRRAVAAQAIKRETTLAEAPEDFRLHLDLMADYMELSRFDDFDALLEKVVVMPGAPREEVLSSLQALATRGRLDQVARLMELRREVTPDDRELLYQLAAVQAQRGEKEVSLTIMRQLWEDEEGRERLQQVVQGDRRFDKIREDADFAELIPPGEERPLLPVKEYRPNNAVVF